MEEFERHLKLAVDASDEPQSSSQGVAQLLALSSSQGRAKGARDRKLSKPTAKAAATSETLALDNVCLDYRQLRLLKDRVRFRRAPEASLKKLAMRDCILVDAQRDHNALMATLRELIGAVKDTLQSIDFSRSTVSGRVFYKGREAAVYSSENVSIEGYTTNNIAIIRDDDPPLRVEDNGQQFYYVKTWASPQSRRFYRDYAVLDWLRRVVHVDMTGTPITGYGVTSLAAATGTRLRRLALRNCREVDDRGIFSIVSLCKSLIDLDISGCTKLTPHALLHLPNFAKPQIASLRCVRVAGTCAASPNAHAALYCALVSEGFQGDVLIDDKHGVKVDSGSDVSMRLGTHSESFAPDKPGSKGEIKEKKAPGSTNIQPSTSKECTFLEFLREEVPPPNNSKIINNSGNSDAEPTPASVSDTRKASSGQPAPGASAERAPRARKHRKSLSFPGIKPIQFYYPDSESKLIESEGSGYKDALKVIDLAGNDITSTVISFKSREYSLQGHSSPINVTLDLSNQLINDRLLGIILRRMGSSLVDLDISGTFVTEVGLRALAHCKELRRLSVRACYNVTLKQAANRSIMAAIAAMPNLSEIELDDTRLSGRSLSAHPNLRLRRLSAARCPISVHALLMLAETCAETLEELRLPGCNYLNSECIACLAEFPKLQRLNLAHCKGLSRADVLEMREQALRDDNNWKALRFINISGVRGVDFATVRSLRAALGGAQLHVEFDGQGAAMTTSIRASTKDPTGATALVSTTPDAKSLLADVTLGSPVAAHRLGASQDKAISHVEVAGPKRASTSRKTPRVNEKKSSSKGEFAGETALAQYPYEVLTRARVEAKGGSGTASANAAASQGDRAHHGDGESTQVALTATVRSKPPDRSQGGAGWDRVKSTDWSWAPGRVSPRTNTSRVGVVERSSTDALGGSQRSYANLNRSDFDLSGGAGHAGAAVEAKQSGGVAGSSYSNLERAVFSAE